MHKEPKNVIRKKGSTAVTPPFVRKGELVLSASSARRVREGGGMGSTRDCGQGSDDPVEIVPLEPGCPMTDGAGERQFTDESDHGHLADFAIDIRVKPATRARLEKLTSVLAPILRNRLGFKFALKLTVLSYQSGKLCLAFFNALLERIAPFSGQFKALEHSRHRAAPLK